MPSVPQKEYCISLLPLWWRTNDHLYHSKTYDITTFQAGSKALSTINQPDRKSATELKLSIALGEVIEQDHVVVTHKVRAHTAIGAHHRDHGLVQVPCDVHAANSQAAGENSIYCPINFS